MPRRNHLPHRKRKDPFAGAQLAPRIPASRLRPPPRCTCLEGIDPACGIHGGQE